MQARPTLRRYPSAEFLESDFKFGLEFAEKIRIAGNLRKIVKLLLVRQPKQTDGAGSQPGFFVLLTLRFLRAAKKVNLGKEAATDETRKRDRRRKSVLVPCFIRGQVLVCPPRGKGRAKAVAGHYRLHVLRLACGKSCPGAIAPKA